MTKNLLSIAGYDPSGGAGVGLDIRVFARFGFRGFGVLTAVTAQNAAGVKKAFPLPAGLVRSQYLALAEETRLAGIKVGMAGTLENLTATARILASNPSLPRVVDPVFRSSSGAPLLETRAVRRFLEILGGNATLITPNLDEAAALAGRRAGTVDGMKDAAREIFQAGSVPCLVKGGHLRGAAADVLFDGKAFTVFRHARVAREVHGTGCYLSAAILGCLSEGLDLEPACRRAIRLTVEAVRKAGAAGRARAVFSFGP
ncbi:MAG: hydroxymethylpyrimidine/phosphomethylpyrimidine kinase [Acidobacteriota bacterium]